MKIQSRFFVATLLMLAISLSASAQVKLEDIPFNLDDLLGKTKILTVKKGFSPVFNLGKFQINKIGVLGEKLKGVEILGQIFDKKGVSQVTKLYKTYKTGLIVFKVLAAAGTAATVYSTVKGATADNNFKDKTVKALLVPALTSLATGVITKIITKKASYKAVDIFNGVVKKTMKDIFSIAPASSNYGIGVYVKL
ncbi:MAG: hypothetical protein ABIO05_04265 [Ferruginibacter sp.]